MGKRKEKKSTGNISRRRVTLFLEAPEAEVVSLLGDFNQWNTKKHPMKKDADGVWKKIIMVPPGKYEYRFLVDGEWWNDPVGSEVCANCYGSLNNILKVPSNT